jgi:3-oxoacyl-[acyl-carrier protein] reductase
VIAQILTRSGHRTGIHYHKNLESAQKLAKALPETILVQGDLSKSNDIYAIAAAIEEQWGRLDVLINNAAITDEKLILKTSEEMFDKIVEVNLRGPALLTRALAPLIEKQGGGHVINIASLAGTKGRAGLGAYSASKAGLIGLTKVLAVELADCNIRVNAVVPGYLMTPMGLAASTLAKQQALKASLLHRYGDPEETAWFIDYLIRTESVTGQVFYLDSRVA